MKGGQPMTMMMAQPLLCPWCRKGKFFPRKNPRGVMSVKCDKCHNPVDTDWDQRIALKGETIRYAS